MKVLKYLMEKFQDERIKKVRKTTKWKFNTTEKLRGILIDCENQAKMARTGGKASAFKDNKNPTEMELQAVRNVS
jgi:hypothetical protein